MLLQPKAHLKITYANAEREIDNSDHAETQQHMWKERGKNNKELFADLIGSFADDAKLARCFGIHISLSTPPHMQTHKTPCPREGKRGLRRARFEHSAPALQLSCVSTLQGPSAVVRWMGWLPPRSQSTRAPMWPPLDFGLIVGQKYADFKSTPHSLFG